MEEVPVILVVEDNPDHSELIKIALNREFKKAQIIQAFKASECLNVIAEVNLDLIILDYSLPDQNGIVVLEKIRKFDDKLPVLMVTGQGDESIAVKAMKMAATDYIIKSHGYLKTLPVSVFKIISERKERLRLHETEIYYKDLVENAIDGIYLLDDAGYFRLVNDIIIKTTGYSKKQLIGSHFSFLFEEKEYKRLLSRFKKDHRLKRLVQYQTSIICKTGKHLPVELSIIPVRKKNTIIGYQGIVYDISERIRMEKEKLHRSKRIQQMNKELIEKNKKLQELHDLKTQFVSNVGHELRTPLNGILGYAELLKDELYGKVNQSQKEALENIRNSGNHLLNLINELLEFAKIQSGKFKIYKEYASVYDIVDATIVTIQPSINEKKLKLIINLENDLPKIFVDAQKIYQVLLNLFSNAVKFTSQGEIEVNVSKVENFIIFKVRDTGIGISKKDSEKIFQDFNQADGSFTRKYGGTGLGLSLAKYLVELHEGEIWMESVLKKGSKFLFKIPIIYKKSEVKKKQLK